MGHGRISKFEQQFNTALSEFDDIRREETRISACGQVFVLMDNVTKRLKLRSPTCPQEYTSDLDRLQRTAYLQYKPEPPQMRAQHYEEEDYLAIFYTLLDLRTPNLIHRFRNNGLGKLPIELSTLKRCIKPPSKPSFADFHKRFYEKQFDWCPIRFELGMGQIYRDSVSPFSRKEEITPYREGAGPRLNNATLYAIDVPEELVGPRLQTKMASAKIERRGRGIHGSNSKGLRYRFALKQFKPHKSDQFHNERKVFNNLEHEEGMIQYIGWFGSFEPGNDGTQQEYFNIVLELADFDFYSAIRTESPPISFEEIKGFWESMSDISKTLASIHTVSIDGLTYSTWHGDIKPENILRVNDRFKLADPGEASMLLKLPGKPHLSNPKYMGGTRTYAAPEKSAYLEENSTNKPQVTPKSDVWSLGCLFSVAATYVILGKQGVLIYDRLRRYNMLNGKGRMSDAFHDDHRVIPEVTHWHRYLREAARKTDFYTAALLDVVDNHMLVAGENRWKSKEVCESFEKILAVKEPEISKVPPGLQNQLQRIELEVKRTSDHKSGIKRVDSNDTTNELESINLTPAEIESESWKKLLEIPIEPTAQRPRTIRGSPPQSPRPSLSICSGVPPLSQGRFSLSPVQTDFPGLESDDAPKREPIKAAWVKQELRKIGLTYQPSLRSFSSLINRKQTAVKGKTMGKTALDKLDSRLEEEFKNRDMVFLVDNGTTMSKCWTQATELLEVLVWRALGYDDNGMELYFTDPDTDTKAPVKESPGQSVRKFTRAMELAEPAEATTASAPRETTIVPELERIINGYTRAKTSKTEPRKKTIIVLTDGIWQGMHDEYTLDKYLVSAFHCLKDLHGDLSPVEAGQRNQKGISKVRPVTIQFVQFGDDTKATKRLRRLDDDLTKRYGCPDLIDTEHAEGDIYKMFLGSLCPDIDRTLRYSLGGRSSSPANSVEDLDLTDRRSIQRNSSIQVPTETPLFPRQRLPVRFPSADFSTPHHHPRPAPPPSHHELPAVSHDDIRGVVSPISPRMSSPQSMREPSWQDPATHSDTAASPWPAPLAHRHNQPHQQPPRSPTCPSHTREYKYY